LNLSSNFLLRNSTICVLAIDAWFGSSGVVGVSVEILVGVALGKGVAVEVGSGVNVGGIGEGVNVGGTEGEAGAHPLNTTVMKTRARNIFQTDFFMT
jgi:hypothetical protein